VSPLARRPQSRWRPHRRDAPCRGLGERRRPGPQVGAFTIRNGKIVEIDVLVDPDRIARLDRDVLDD
jgi:hypothetical protein